MLVAIGEEGRRMSSVAAALLLCGARGKEKASTACLTHCLQVRAAALPGMAIACNPLRLLLPTQLGTTVNARPVAAERV
jgi:hypothetical protein